MATTTMGTTTTTRTTEANRRLYWGIAIALVVVIAIAFAMRTSRNDVVTTTVTSTPAFSDTTSATTTVPADTMSERGLEPNTANMNAGSVNDTGAANSTNSDTMQRDFGTTPAPRE